MKYLILILSSFVYSICFAQLDTDKTKVDYNDFKFTYIYAGLGSERGTKQAVFKVRGKNYFYTLEQNSHYGKKTLQSDSLYSGIFRTTSIDSIVGLIKNEIDTDTLIYKTNPHIRSGGVHSINVSTENLKITFTLNNISDLLAEKIVAIVNSNIPITEDKLWLFKSTNKNK